MIDLNYNQYMPLEKLYDIAEKDAENYKNAAPFAHAYYDNVFDSELLDQIIEEFEQGDKNWFEHETKYEKKFEMSRDAQLQPVTRAFIHNLNSEPFLKFLESLTGISGLISDPYLRGGGLHKIQRGGKLGVHVDFNGHRIMKVYRRLNVLIYLNRDWPDEYGGHLELWDQKTNVCVKRILPIFNRMAIFTTTPTSFHGHPEPLNCPQDRCRRSLALYYYTADQGEQKYVHHATQFLTDQGRREELNVGLYIQTKRKIRELLKF